MRSDCFACRLTEAQRRELIADLDGGMTMKAAAAKAAGWSVPARNKPLSASSVSTWYKKVRSERRLGELGAMDRAAEAAREEEFRRGLLLMKLHCLREGLDVQEVVALERNEIARLRLDLAERKHEYAMWRGDLKASLDRLEGLMKEAEPYVRVALKEEKAQELQRQIDLMIAQIRYTVGIGPEVTAGMVAGTEPLPTPWKTSSVWKRSPGMEVKAIGAGVDASAQMGTDADANANAGVVQEAQVVDAASVGEAGAAKAEGSESAQVAGREGAIISEAGAGVDSAAGTGTGAAEKQGETPKGDRAQKVDAAIAPAADVSTLLPPGGTRGVVPPVGAVSPMPAVVPRSKPWPLWRGPAMVDAGAGAGARSEAWVAAIPVPPPAASVEEIDAGMRRILSVMPKPICPGAMLHFPSAVQWWSPGMGK